MTKTQPKCQIKFLLTPPEYDHDYLPLEQEVVGLGYLGRIEPKSIGLIQCPQCGRENHAPYVSTGSCAWCNFDLKKEVEAYASFGKTLIPTSTRRKKASSQKVQIRKKTKIISKTHKSHKARAA